MTDKQKTTAPPPDQDQRDLILNELDRNMLVEAAAGTGKTTSMVGRMVALLRNGKCRIGAMAAVTFTRKAAAELRARFQVEIERAARNASGKRQTRLEEALTHVEQCFIGTIHSFCARLLKERPVEARVDPAFEEIDDEQDLILRREAWQEYAAELLAGRDEVLLADFARLGLEPGQLQDAFLQFADYHDVDDWPVPEPLRQLPNMNATLCRLQEYVTHMRSLFPRLPDAWGNDNLIPKYRRLPRIISHYYDLSHPPALMDALRFFDKKAKLVQKEWTQDEQFTKEDAKAERDRWEQFREEVVAPMLTAWRERRYAPIIRALTHARAYYDNLRRERGKLNYQDLLMKAAELLRERPHVREYFRRRFTHLLVDEFQDTDPIQAEVILLLTADDVNESDWRKCRPRPGSLFVVGDPKQSIYRFRRADIIIYNEVRRIIQESGAAGITVGLRANFRTTKPIIDWVNQVFQAEFPYVHTEQSPAYRALEVGRPDKEGGYLEGLKILRIPEACTNQESTVKYEADFIARTIRHALDSAEASAEDFMIVTRAKKRLAAYARKLQDYGVAHQVTGGSALNEVDELRLLYLCLRAVAHPDNPVFLVAALRSELFGISDAALYDFKSAGGKFCYRDAARSEKSEGLDPLEDAFARLRQYSGWLNKLPPLAAIERMVADLGLMALAASRPGGDVQAGSLAKAIEVLRSIEADTWTIAQIVGHLELLLATPAGAAGRPPRYDGISARSKQMSMVRIMNLHKVKGLEAPVVFLAGPHGETKHPVTLHIDRSGTHILGYMAVYKERNRWGKAELLAHPPHWEELAAREQEFLDAEAIRLRYVAATRAGSALVITQHTRKSENRKNPWKYFEPHLGALDKLGDPGEQTAPVRKEAPLARESMQAAIEEISTRRSQAARRTYETRSAKEYARKEMAPIAEGIPFADADDQSVAVPADGEHGIEWGSAIHQLLELAMENPGAELRQAAIEILPQHDLEVARVDEAVEVINAVTSSDLWQRAQRSSQCFTEAPFHILAADIDEETNVPTLLRGVIDLVFREGGGWALVDYKTDDPDQETLGAYTRQVALYARAWKRCTGARVKEAGLFFTRNSKFFPVSLI